MKKTTVLAFCMAMTTLLSACGSGSDSQTAESSSDSSSSAAVTEAAELNTEDSAAETEATSVADESSESASSEDLISQIKEYNIHIPAVFSYINKGSRRLFQTETDSGSTVYYSLINILDYAHVHADETYTLDDAPEITWDNILEDLRALDLPAGASKSECVVDTDEKRQMLGNDVIRRTGTLKLVKSGNTMDLAYAAYYMVADMQNGDYKQVPVVWIAFSEDTSDETKAFLEEAVDLTFEKSEIAS